ncbi:LysR family transcriptional regulator [Mesorhizobium sp.]|uniref:LysR family transcriptional regulator n=1 Tax=Mesorhizobium sp. TaxID=1871066 RepID=UPI000FE7CF1E|nr:LysR family transcriptional regulator [Mesorhizobium sp.]RWB66478.1 MAG: LysR family transcriptional regulator [Mesorhizobium sp.]RWB90712.1 MAG: LysR family transcriptional regulator [Mesorhizobium sp.]
MNLIASMDVDLLLALDALLQDRNITHAAARLGISQPALSARLTRLRTLLDDRLFIPAPNGRGVLPTPRAEALIPLVAGVLRQIRAILEPATFDPVSSDRVFTLALEENPAIMLGPSLVQRARAGAPNLRLRLAVPNRKQIPTLLESGDVDIFVGIAAGAENAWIGRRLFDDDFATAQRKGHPRGRGPLDLDAFCGAAHLLVSSEGNPFSGFIDRALGAIGRSRLVAMSVQSYAVAPTIVAGSDLLCTLPTRMLRHFDASLDLFAPPISLKTIGISAYWHPRHQEDPGHQWLRAQLFAAAGSVELN